MTKQTNASSKKALSNNPSKIGKEKKHKIRDDVKKFRKHGNKTYTIHLYLVEMAKGFAGIFFQKSSSNEAGFTRSFENRVDIENDSNTMYRDALDIYDELYRRGPNNEKLPAKPGSTFGWKMWLTKLPDSSLGAQSAAHRHARMEWMRRILDEVNRLGSDPNEYRIYTRFQFAGDLTVGDGLPLDRYLLTDDVIEIFKTTFLPDDAPDNEVVFEVLDEYQPDLFAGHRGETIVDCMKRCLNSCGINVNDEKHDEIVNRLKLQRLRD